MSASRNAQNCASRSTDTDFRNLVYSKQFFWFGSDAIESKSLSHYRRGEKSTDAAQHNSAWASQTGKGLLFFGEKSAPTGIINLVSIDRRDT